MTTTDQDETSTTTSVAATAPEQVPVRAARERWVAVDPRATRSGPVTLALAGSVVTELRAELDRAVAAGDAEGRRRVHELLSGCLAARGEWRHAYLELRAAVDLSRGGSGAGEQQRLLLEEVALLRQVTAEAQHASFTDSLTETFNRRFLDTALRSLTEQQAQDPDGAAVQTCVALVDLDLFKLVNDSFGHATGDQVLQRVVELLQTDLPPLSFCARYGGEEFVLVLPGVELEQAVALCERARDRIQRDDWSRLGDGLRVTVSIGLAGPRSAEAGAAGAQDQLLRADSLLYSAKNSGRNAVAFRTSTTSAVQLAGPAGLRRVVVDAPTA